MTNLFFEIIIIILLFFFKDYYSIIGFVQLISSDLIQFKE